MNLEQLSLDIPELLERLSVGYIHRSTNPNALFRQKTSGNGSLQMCCPFHAESGPSFGVMLTYPYKYHCFACQTKGTIVSLVAHSLGLWTHEAMHWLASSFEVHSPLFIDIEALFGGGNRKQILPPEAATQFMKPVQHEYILKQRGFKQEVADTFMYGYNEFLDAITMPVWDHTGNIRYIKQRFINPINGEKYYNEEGVAKADIIYGLNFMIKHGIRRFYLNEGEFNSGAMYQCGMPAVALGTSSITEEQVKLLKLHADWVGILFDNDKAGYSGRLKVANELDKYMDVAIVDLSRQHNDPNDAMKAGRLRKQLLRHRSLMEINLGL